MSAAQQAQQAPGNSPGAARQRKAITPADLFDADTMGRISYFGDLLADARVVEAFARSTATVEIPQPTIQTGASREADLSDALSLTAQALRGIGRKVHSASMAASEAGSLIGTLLTLTEGLYEELAREKDLRRDLERRVQDLENLFTPSEYRGER